MLLVTFALKLWQPSWMFYLLSVCDGVHSLPIHQISTQLAEFEISFGRLLFRNGSPQLNLLMSPRNTNKKVEHHSAITPRVLFIYFLIEEQ